MFKFDFYFFYLPATCPEYGTTYNGTSIVDIEDVPSWDHCSGYCKLLTDCRAWSYINDPTTCYLKNSDVGKVPHPNALSGLRKCGNACKLYHHSF